MKKWNKRKWVYRDIKNCSEEKCLFDLREEKMYWFVKELAQFLGMSFFSTFFMQIPDIARKGKPNSSFCTATCQDFCFHTRMNDDEAVADVCLATRASNIYARSPPFFCNWFSKVCGKLYFPRAQIYKASKINSIVHRVTRYTIRFIRFFSHDHKKQDRKKQRVSATAWRILLDGSVTMSPLFVRYSST